jgi:threonine dehydratase
MIPYEWLLSARERIKEIIIPTPITYDADRNIYLKWENRQVTGSYKIRGAANKIFTLSKWELEKGLVACSAGNHGQGVALAAKKVHAACEIFASTHAVPAKVEAMKQLGAKIHFVDGDYAAVEKAAIDFASTDGKTFISPYNDAQVIAGQGTVGLELIDQLDQMKTVKAVLVPIGGGGLASGIGAALENLHNPPRLIGVQSEASSYFYKLYYEKTQAGVVELESIADGLAGAVDPQSLTIPTVAHYVDEIVLVSEEQIKGAIVFAWINYHEVIEGSAAVTLAAVLGGKIIDLPAALIITGGNIQPQIHKDLVDRVALSK